ncbi:MAG: hypothetical protein R3A52_24245 [Polyangiales bacterium]
MSLLLAALIVGCAAEEPVEQTSTPPEPETAYDAGRSADDNDVWLVLDAEPAEDVTAPAPPDAGAPIDVTAPIDLPPPPMDSGPPPPVDAGPPPPVDDGPPPPVDAGPPERVCTLRSTTFADAMQELDVGPTSAERLRFTVRAVPAGASRVILHFDSHDADHPGQEGWITVDGRGRFPIPADAAWDNVTTRDNRVDVTSASPSGDAVIAFGPGPLSRSFFRVGAVWLEVTARVATCPGETAPVDAGTPTGARPVERTVSYRAARYTNRFNWVHRCSANYAYTARGADHLSEDCDGAYRPDGTLRGTATFTFSDVIAGQYDVVVRSRHSTNRNSMGALFIVNGERGRINQRDDLGGLNLWEDTWGRRSLSGTVTVVLDTTVNNGSDSVSAVILRPVR